MPLGAGSRISFPFPLAPALFSPAGMKFEESLNIGSRDGGGVVLLLGRKSIFFDEVYIFFLWTVVRSRNLQKISSLLLDPEQLFFPVDDVLEKCI